MTQETRDPTFHHGSISGFNAWFFTALAGYINHISKVHKDQAFAGIGDADTVVEIGAGTGANFGHLSPGTRLHAVEPSRAMHPRLRQRAAAHGIDLRLHPGGAEKIDLPDNSVDEVICSLVLCTVQDPQAVLAEVHRVLRAGGRFRFVEHVAASGRLRGWVQQRIRGPWGWLFEGCHPHRDTATDVLGAGFASAQIRYQPKLRHSVFWPLNSCISGIAIR